VWNPPSRVAEHLAMLRHWIATGRGLLPELACSAGQGGPPADRWPLGRSLTQCFPGPVRRHTLLLVPHESPGYVRRLTPAEQTAYAALFPANVHFLQSLGFAALEVGRDYPSSAYVDRCHLSEEGGRRLAAEVAPKVRELARHLGYLGAGRPR